MTLFSLFTAAARDKGGQPAILEGAEVITYAQLQDRIVQSAANLENRLNDRSGGVALWLRNAGDVLTAFLACCAAGRPAAPVSPDAPAKHFTALVAQYPFAGLIADVDEPDAPGTERLRLADLGTSGTAATFQAASDPAREFYWGLTSGTTGTPKLTARSHASWIASFEAAEQVFDFPEGAVILVPGPLHHSLFLYGAVHGLCRGLTVVLPEGAFRPDRFSGLRATHLYAVPFMLNKLIAARAAFPSLTHIFSGGAKLGSVLRQSCETLWPGADLIEFYGATETSFVSYNSTHAPAPTGSVGKPFPGVAIRVAVDDGTTAAPGETGGIEIASPMLFSRYVGGGAAGRWVSAGDRGYLDRDGYLYLTGRANRVINTKGLKIQPEPIEAVLMRCGKIESAVVIGLPDTLRGETLVAVVKFRPGVTADRKTLSARCRAEFGSAACPQRFFACETLPRTSSGKTAVAAIREALIAGRSGFRELR